MHALLVLLPGEEHEHHDEAQVHDEAEHHHEPDAGHRDGVVDPRLLQEPDVHRGAADLGRRDAVRERRRELGHEQRPRGQRVRDGARHRELTAHVAHEGHEQQRGHPRPVEVLDLLDRALHVGDLVDEDVDGDAAEQPQEQ